MGMSVYRFSINITTGGTGTSNAIRRHSCHFVAIESEVRVVI